MTVRPTVSLVKCPTYVGLTEPEKTGLQAAMEKLLSPLGGMNAFVKPGQSVLVKPNLLTDRTPDQAVTTHPEIVRAIIRMVKDVGGRPAVADSPNNVVKLDEVWLKTGFKALCEEEDVPLLNLEKSGSVTFDTAAGTFSLAKPVLEADVIINVPKVKTHVLTILTAAVKNMFGAVPGLQKSNLHKLHPTPADFGKLLLEVYRNAGPHLNIADAVVGMDGDGPSAGRAARLGFLAASTDAGALDFVLCRILKINPRAVSYLKHLQEEEPDKWKEIEIVGDDIEEISPASFRVPSTLLGRLIPGGLVRRLNSLLWIRPSITDLCTQCDRCVTACPVEALTKRDGQPPILDPQKCIGCCCCHEICPAKAIVMIQSPLLNFVRRGKIP